MENLPEPTLEYVCSRLDALNGQSGFYGAERALELVFGQWPENSDLEHVQIKTILLNRAYSTGIYDVWSVAQHVHGLSIDERLRRGDESLVHDLAALTISGKQRNFYSFATKYCSWHEPEKFQIYDGYVDWLVWMYQKRFRFDSFRRHELRDYSRFVQIVERMRHRFGLTPLGRKQLDKFLWAESWEQQAKVMPGRGIA